MWLYFFSSVPPDAQSGSMKESLYTSCLTAKVSGTKIDSWSFNAICNLSRIIEG